MPGFIPQRFIAGPLAPMQKKMKYTTIICLVLLSFAISAQEAKIGIISDPDGYVNIRQEKSTQSEIVGKIKEGDRFYFYPKAGEVWWKIEVEFGNETGFVHKSRISELHIKSPYCQCLFFEHVQTDLPNFQFNIGGLKGTICGYLLNRISENKIKISEFSITDCQKDEMIVFYSAVQTCYIEIIDEKLKITEVTQLPFGKNWNWIELPLKERNLFLGTDNELVLGAEKSVLNYSLSNEKIEQYLEMVESKRKNNESFEIETTIGAILKCALNGNQKAKDILLNFNDYFGFKLDGAFQEFYNDAISIYNFINE
jgi:hypothetical protein